MLSIVRMKSIFQHYVDGFERADAQAVIALFAEDASIEDPVGSKVHVGRAAIVDFYNKAIAAETVVKVRGPIRGAPHGNALAVVLETLEPTAKGLEVYSRIDVFRFDDSGKIISRQSFYGPDDLLLVTPG